MKGRSLLSFCLLFVILRYAAAMPEVKSINVPKPAAMGVAIEGSTAELTSTGAILPNFNSLIRHRHYIDIFNKGQEPFTFTIRAGVPWLKLSSSKGTIESELRVWVDIDWMKAPKGIQSTPITITGAHGTKVTVTAKINNILATKSKAAQFAEADGAIAIEAEHYSKAMAPAPLKWQVIPQLGRTLSGMTIFPVTAPMGSLNSSSPHLQYQIHLSDTGIIKVHTLLSPTLNFHNTQGLRFAISIDDEAPQVINMHEGENNQLWEQWVASNIIDKAFQHRITRPGLHTLKFWAVDPGVVLQKLVIDVGGLNQSYLGPEETMIK